MYPSNNSSSNTIETNSTFYRSAFSSAFRNSIRYGVERRYRPDRPILKLQSSKDTKNINTVEDSEKGAQETKDSKTTKLLSREHTGYVGFANLPNQIYSKATKKGFEFTLMVVGASGLGKSTLINSMFQTDIYDPATYPGPSARCKKTVCVETTRIRLTEGGVDLTLTLIDTPGFGDAINNEECWVPITEHVDEKFEDFFTSEYRINRIPAYDQRIHCCLYFIQPTGHGLKALDIEFMKQLCGKVNIVPVIAKADTLTPEECFAFKKEIIKNIERNDIKIYNFPNISEEDEEYELNKNLKELVPFAVVGSNTVIELDGKKVRGRTYPWGAINIENLEHCDFVTLRKMVIGTHMQDLKDTTHDVHYENYRYRKLAALTGDGKTLTKSLIHEFEEAIQNHEVKLRRIEADMENLLKEQVRKQEKELKDTEKLLKMRFETTKRTLGEEIKEFEEKRRLFELEKELWEKEKQACGRNSSCVTDL